MYWLYKWTMGVDVASMHTHSYRFSAVSRKVLIAIIGINKITWLQNLIHSTWQCRQLYTIYLALVILLVVPNPFLDVGDHSDPDHSGCVKTVSDCLQLLSSVGSTSIFQYAEDVCACESLYQPHVLQSWISNSQDTQRSKDPSDNGTSNMFC